MRQTKKLSLCAVTVALSVVFLLLGAVFEPIDLAVGCLASALMVFVFIEIGSPYTYLVWLGTSLLSALVFPAGLAWISYFLVFGIYPVVKGYIERLKRHLWWLIKIAYAAVSATVLYLVTAFILGIPTEPVFGLAIEITYVILGTLALVCFVLYDIFITALVRVYYLRLRPKIKDLLK